MSDDRTKAAAYRRHAREAYRMVRQKARTIQRLQQQLEAARQELAAQWRLRRIV